MKKHLLCVAMVISVFPLCRAQTEAGAPLLSDTDALYQAGARLAGAPDIGTPLQLAEYGCATVLLIAIRESWNDFSPLQQDILSPLFVRPSLPFDLVSPSGRFRVHYAVEGGNAVTPGDANNNGIPDQVEGVAAALDTSFEIEVNVLGYRPHPDDEGIDGPEYDVYIQNTNGSIYGFTQPESPVGNTARDDRTSYIVIDNDFNNGHFRTGLAAARVTVAHEYFHALQIGYRINEMSEFFYYEFCAIWMEEVVFDEVNDYYQYLPLFFRRRSEPFNLSQPINFGEAVWNLFLQKKLGQPDFVRRTWELIEGNQRPMSAISRTLEELGTSFGAEFARFAIWNYFTADRADPDLYYDEGPSYPSVSFDGSFTIRGDTTVVDSSLASSHRYFRFIIGEDGDYTLSGVVDDSDDWKLAAITLKPAQAPVTRIVDGISLLPLGFLPAGSEVVAIPVATEILDGPDLPQLGTSYRKFQLSIGRTSGAQITSIFPNPFFMDRQQSVQIEFIAAGAGEAAVRVISADGRVVRSEEVQHTGGLQRWQWDGRDDDNQAVAAGVYVIYLSVGDRRLMRKLAVLR